MFLPQNLHKKYLDRFDELIEDGEYLYGVVKNTPSGHEQLANSLAGIQNRPLTSEETKCNDSVQKWLINYKSLLDQIIPTDSIHRQLLVQDNSHLGYSYQLKIYVSQLRGLKDDFDKGFFSNLSLQVEAEIAADYMAQAEQLLTKGQSGQYDHVPAAVLTGAVLEKGLRTICTNQTPPLSIVTPKGDPLMMNRLIDDLKKADVFNELKAKQLRGWVDIRNAAAHGHFDQFTRSDVETMIGGINNFLVEYLS
jgi:hypothetical protein